MDSRKLKKLLFENCFDFVANRAKTVQDIIASNQKSLQSETKSSAGDKHETGRAMLQLEMEKASQQLASIDQMKAILHKINPEIISKNVQLGSVVITSLANYFLTIGMGKIEIDKKEYYAVSPSSPIGKKLLGSKAGDILLFNEKKFEILEVF
jgi:transcription elongation GreA/GreB family factor